MSSRRIGVRAPESSTPRGRGHRALPDADGLGHAFGLQPGGAEASALDKVALQGTLRPWRAWCASTTPTAAWKRAPSLIGARHKRHKDRLCGACGESVKSLRGDCEQHPDGSETKRALPRVCDEFVANVRADASGECLLALHGLGSSEIPRGLLTNSAQGHVSKLDQALKLQTSRRMGRDKYLCLLSALDVFRGFQLPVSKTRGTCQQTCAAHNCTIAPRPLMAPMPTRIGAAYTAQHDGADLKSDQIPANKWPRSQHVRPT